MGAITNEALTDLYRRRVDLVYQICLTLMRNGPDAEDLTQDVFRKVLERSEPFRDPEHERAWLISGHWTCTLTLPDEDPGRWCALDRPLTLNGEETVLHAVYVSPLTFGFDLREGGGDWPTAAQAYDAVTGGDATDGDTIGLALRTADGRTVAAGESILLSTRFRTDLRAEGTGRYLFRLAELVDPDAVVSCTLFGQSFPLWD